MEPKFGARSVEHDLDSIVCSNCGKTGKLVWGEVSRVNKSAVPEIHGIDGPFFERLSERAPYPIELVCRACGEVAASAFPSTSLHDRREYN